MKNKRNSTTIARTFAAPRPLVFEAFTKPEHIVEWWQPEGVLTKIIEHDFRISGHWHYRIKGPTKEYSSVGRFHDIKSPERIVLIEYANKNLNQIEDVMIIANFAEVEQNTKLTLNFLPLPSKRFEPVNCQHWQLRLTNLAAHCQHLMVTI